MVTGSRSMVGRREQQRSHLQRPPGDIYVIALPDKNNREEPQLWFPLLGCLHVYLYAQGHLCVEVTPEMGCISSSEDKALTGLNKQHKKRCKTIYTSSEIKAGKGTCSPLTYL